MSRRNLTERYLAGELGRVPWDQVGMLITDDQLTEAIKLGIEIGLALTRTRGEGNFLKVSG